MQPKKRRSFGVLLLILPLSLLMGARSVYPSGSNIGIEMRTDGLVITGTYDVSHSGGSYNPASSDIKKGDKITKANDVDVRTIDAFLTILKNSQYNYVKLQLKRDATLLTRSLQLYRNANGTYKTGLFVKEKVVGIGTMTYIDPSNRTFGSLGHHIADNGEIFEVTNGTIYDSNVIGVKKSEPGNPGEKVAQIDTSTAIGDVVINCEAGVFGHTQANPVGPLLEVASINQIKLGEAEIWTVLSGHQIDKYQISITAIDPGASIKGITFKVVDKTLVSKTNGIIQGMSGSPIIQNNLIIGAITHVVIDKPTQGYGIFLTQMLAQSDQLS